MSTQYSIAEARHNLAALVHELEHQASIELTRRGEPVAVLLSVREYQRLTSPTRRFWAAYEAFRQTVNLPELGIDENVFAGVRDVSPGREAHL